MLDCDDATFFLYTKRRRNTIRKADGKEKETATETLVVVVIIIITRCFMYKSTESRCLLFLSVVNGKIRFLLQDFLWRAIVGSKKHKLCMDMKRQLESHPQSKKNFSIRRPQRESFIFIGTYSLRLPCFYFIV